jgi:hypothetical protein
MILYNVTTNVDHSVQEDWLRWMRETHIPEVMSTGLFTEHRLCRLIGDEQSGGVTYSIQYVCRSMQDFEEYNSKYAPRLREDVVKRYGDKFVAFRTLLEIIS